LLIAILIWVVAVNDANPIQESMVDKPIPVLLKNLPPGMIIMEVGATTAQVTLRAPKAVWEVLDDGMIHVSADLSNLGSGEYDLPITWEIDQATTRVTKITPTTVHVRLERSATRNLQLRLTPQGEPALGYEAGKPVAQASVISVTGPASLVDRVSEVLLAPTLTNQKADVNETLAPVAVDASGNPVTDVLLNPSLVKVVIPITQKLGFRDVAVRAVITGLVASGYRVVNITVSPLVVTVSSSDPEAVNALPGYVDTQALDISNAKEARTSRLSLNLPPGVTPVGEGSAFVQVTIAPIEDSQRRPLTLQLHNLGVGLAAKPSPETVEVLISGPLPVLDSLTADAIIVSLDLQGLGIGTHQVAPRVTVLPEQLRVENILPSAVEVNITLAPSPTLTITATPVITPTRRP
jgi:YbbR domain-containing protein